MPRVLDQGDHRRQRACLLRRARRVAVVEDADLGQLAVAVVERPDLGGAAEEDDRGSPLTPFGRAVMKPPSAPPTRIRMNSLDDGVPKPPPLASAVGVMTNVMPGIEVCEPCTLLNGSRARIRPSVAGRQDVGGQLDDVAFDARLLQGLVAVRRRLAGDVDLARGDAHEAERDLAVRC